MNGLAIFSFVFFTALVAFISWKMTRKENLKSNKGYFLGGRSLTGAVIAGSLLLTNLSTEQLVGMNGSAFIGGASVIAWEVTSGLTLVFMGLIFLPRYLKSGLTTVPEFLEDRFDKGTRNLVAILFLLSLGVIFLPIVLYSGGLAMESLFNVSNTFNMSKKDALILMIWGIGTIGSIYAIFGGLKAVAISDTINGIGLLIGGLLIPVLGLIVLGEGNFFDGIDKILTEHPEKINAIGTNDSPVPFSTLFTGMILINTFYWCTNQAIVQRVFGAKNLAEGQKGVLYAAFLKMFAPLILVVPGIIAFHLYSGDIQTRDLAYPTLVNNILPKPLIGFFGAVLFGAILSSFNSALNSASTLFCINLYKPILSPKIKDEKLVKIGKIFGIILAVSAMLLAPYIADAPNGLFIFMKKFMGFFNIPTLVIILVGFFTTRVPAIAAKIATVIFMTFYGILVFVYKPDINFLHILGILFALCLAIMLIIGKLYPRATPYIQKSTGEVNLKYWKNAYAISTLVVTTLIYLYTLFSPVGIVGAGDSIINKFLTITGIYIALSAVLIKYVKNKYDNKTCNNVDDTDNYDDLKKVENITEAEAVQNIN